MIRAYSLLILMLCGSMTCLHAQQEQQKKEASGTAPKKKKLHGDRMFNLDVLAGIDHPMGDMTKRFGTSYRLGLGLKIKTRTNWLIGVKGELLMGNKIREDSLLWNMETQYGVITQLGDVLHVGTFERGYLVGAQVGYIFPLAAVNPNSGPFTLMTIGFMQHKIKLFDKDNSFPQLRDAYVKGYDRLTNGAYIENTTGYMFYSRNRLVNIYAGVDFVYAVTRGRRDYQFDLARKDDARRHDLLLGLKFGWVVPIYKKAAEDIYY